MLTLPEFVSYLGERRVLCVGNGWHFCTPVLMNMCNITFRDLRSKFTFFSNKCLEIIIFTIIFVVKSLKGFGWNDVDSSSQTVAQHYISIGPMYRLIRCFRHRDFKGHQHNAAVRKDCTITQFCFNDGPASKTVGQHWNSIGWMTRVCAMYTTDPGDRLLLGQRRNWLTGIEPAMGCNAGPEFGG